MNITNEIKILLESIEQYKQSGIDNTEQLKSLLYSLNRLVQLQDIQLKSLERKMRSLTSKVA